MNGGRVAYEDSSALEICDRFVHQRRFVIMDPTTRSCEQTITGCSGVIGPGEVARAIDHADVRAAIAAAPVLYGTDPRPFDGAVLRIEIGTAVIEVGNACSGTSNCKAIPTGVHSLAEMLKAVTKQQLTRAPCSITFPPTPLGP